MSPSGRSGTPLDTRADPELHAELHAWLKDHRLHQYYDGFVQKGFEELEDVADMGDEDLSACG
jgi:hypothetical protein